MALHITPLPENATRLTSFHNATGPYSTHTAMTAETINMFRTLGKGHGINLRIIILQYQ